MSAQVDRAGPHELGDFTTAKRVIYISITAAGIGVFSAFVALALLRLIGLFTNLFFFQRWSTALVSPVGNTLGDCSVFPGIFCSTCHEGQRHWDCPNCGRRQDFATAFFYNAKAIAIGDRSVA